MKKIFNNKILLIFVLFLFFILINCRPVSAAGVLVTDGKYTSEFIDDYLAVEQSPFDAFKIIVDYYHQNNPDAITFSSSDLPQYGLLIKHYEYEKNDNGEYEVGETLGYSIYFTSSPLFSGGGFTTISNDVNWILHSCAYDIEYEEALVVDYVYCHLTPNGLKFSSSDILQDSGVSFRPWLNDNSTLDCTRTICSSTYNIANVDNSDEVVFQQPTLRKATVLAPVIQKEREKGTLQTVLKEIILMIPLILVVVVSFLGLRKALRILFKLLRRA